MGHPDEVDVIVAGGGPAGQPLVSEFRTEVAELRSSTLKDAS